MKVKILKCPINTSKTDNNSKNGLGIRNHFDYPFRFFHRRSKRAEDLVPISSLTASAASMLILNIFDPKPSLGKIMIESKIFVEIWYENPIFGCKKIW